MILSKAINIRVGNITKTVPKTNPSSGSRNGQ